MIARSSGAMRSSVQPSAWRAMRLVELLGVVRGRVRERAGERGGVALEELVERAAGELVLVEREDGGAALVGAAGIDGRVRRATCRSPSACRPSPGRRC